MKELLTLYSVVIPHYLRTPGLGTTASQHVSYWIKELSKETMAKRTTNTMVRLKIRRSTPRRVLNTVPALLPPKTLPRPAPRAWSKTKTITAILSIICITRIAGSHSCDKFFLAFIFHPYRGASSSNDFANHNLLWIFIHSYRERLYHTLSTLYNDFPRFCH